MLIQLLFYSLAFILVALVAGNNLSACSGTIIAGRVVRRRTGIMLTILGYILGLLLEGTLLRSSIEQLLPVASHTSVVISFIVPIAIFIVSHKLRVPQSLSITLTASIIGINLAYGHSINTVYVTYMVLFWVVAAFISAVLAFASMKMTRRLTNKMEIWSTVSGIRTLLIIVSFFTAFTLGANTFGLVMSSMASVENVWYTLATIIVAIVFGSLFLSRGELKRIGNEILPIRYLNALVSQFVSALLVELGTVFSIPISNTQMFTTSLYGAGVSYGTRMLLKRPISVILATWVLTGLAAIVASYVITAVLL